MAFRGHTVVVVAACFWLPAVPAQAQWPQCVADLETLGAASEQAREAGGDLSALETSLIQEQDTYTRCTQGLAIYRRDRGTSPIPEAVQRDGCNLQLESYQEVERRYTAEVDRVSAVFSALAAAVQAVEVSCQYPLVAYAPAEPVEEPPAEPRE
ncbi:MAG: hypothetical protein F4Z04_04915 [Acidobacteria bacterium]|nr:hypothetical protein [Acidobacteriota bacterium]